MAAASSRPPEILTPAQNLGSRYELLGRLGSGGMAEVYLARAIGLADFEKIVVLKRILPSSRDDARFIEMFRDEARVAATLEHPNIVHTHDIGVRGTEVFFTMEYLHGEDLKAILSAANKASEPLPLELALQIGVGCAAGLHHAHEQTDYSGRPLNIVHRDVSPSNVIVTRQSGVKLIDFGIAKAASAKQETGVGVLKGKAAYMSPEQCRGEPLDRRSDIFALGIVLYEMIAMRRPFRADNVLDMVGKIIRDAPLPPRRFRPECPAALERIVLKALHKDPKQRYRNAFEVQEDLELATRDCGLLALPGALGRYLEHLFGPKPHPWTKRAEHGAPVAKRNWKELDSTLTRAHLPGGELGPDTAKLDPRRAAARAMAPTRPNMPTLPSDPMGHPRVEAREQEETASDRSRKIPIDGAANGRARPMIAASLVGLALSAAAASMWWLDRDHDDTDAVTTSKLAPAAATSDSKAGVEPKPPTTVAAPSPVPARAAAIDSSPVPKAPPQSPAETADAPASEADVERLLERARLALPTDPTKAYGDAKRAHEAGHNPAAAELMADAACSLKDVDKARDAIARLRGPARDAAENRCRTAGVVLE